MAQDRSAGLEFRRAPHLLLHWQENQLVLHNYAVRRTLPAHAVVIDVLGQFDAWRPLGHYLDTVPAAARNSVKRLVRELHRQRLLWRRDEPLSTAERAMDAWDQWNPSAGFFHSATKDVNFIDMDMHLAQLAEQATTCPMPPAVKEYPRARRVRLPTPQIRGAFPRVLRTRRTWRRFADAPLDLASLSTLLHLSVGVQQWATAEGEGPIALKTSPSGGGRHPIEVYVAVRNVRSLAPGFYHYAASTHALERIGRARRPPPLDTLLPTQWWYRDAAALVLFTAVFERTRWRYNGPRAYRAVLLEAGHVCQTFCLTATWLGLAPFCSMALADTAIEKALGLDGVSESVLYAAGVGPRPALPAGVMPGTLPSRTPRTRMR
jgi:SagB-type dehydrogenase family enzyme